MSLTVLDLFCGAGGASLGFAKAGYEVVGAVDANETAIDIYRQNLCEGDLVDAYPGKVPFDKPLQADLSREYEDDAIDDNLPTVTFEDIRDHFDLAPGEVNIICGCPPCQNFSSLRDTEPWPDNKPKDSLLRAFIEFIEEEVPDVVFFENVQNIMTAGDDVPTTYVDWLERSMERITRNGDSCAERGYGHALDVRNAADYGVPQRRNRAIGVFVYGQDDDDVSLPEPTHAENSAGGEDREEWVTVNEAFSQAESLFQDLEAGEKQVGIDGYPDDSSHRARNHQSRTIERMKAIRKHGDSWRDLKGTEDEEYIVDAHRDLETGADAAYGIMDGDQPAPTLTTKCTMPSSGRFTHPTKNRAITFREAALLMTFPRWFELPSTNDHAETLVGNAVPPDFVSSIADHISMCVKTPVTAN